MKTYALLFGLLVVSMVLLPGCLTPSEKVYVCPDGREVSDSFLCSTTIPSPIPYR